MVALLAAQAAVAQKGEEAVRAAAADYGVPAKQDGDAAYLEIKGVRDLTFGIHVATAVVILGSAALLFAV
ncbi:MULTISPECIES: hypothetical protein [unclassified Spirillospora]|uniref:hypothetical protein n=1 Tax=unclassified Spirillospora TaxID=2642701 RepID=UPI00372057BF